MTVDVSYRGRVATLVLNTGKALNTFEMTGFEALHETLADIAENEAVRAVIVTGHGEAFSAGAALDDFLRDGKIAMDETTLRDRFNRHLNPMMRAIMAFPKPVVIAVNGVVAGGGMGLALSGDIVIAADTAKFHCAFVKMLGIVPDLGTSWLLPVLMGRNKALPFALLGDGITAQEASEAGLIHRAVPADTLMDLANSYADRLADAPRAALVETRKLFTRAASVGLDAILDGERDANSVLVEQPDFTEGVSAFLERRKPNFQTG